MRLCGEVSSSLPSCDLSALTNMPCTTSLPENLTDAQLEAEVTQAFSAFGTVFVKIRRDSKNMPFAFCQYVVSSVIDLFSSGDKSYSQRIRKPMMPKWRLRRARASLLVTDHAALRWSRRTVSYPNKSRFQDGVAYVR